MPRWIWTLLALALAALLWAASRSPSPAVAHSLPGQQEVICLLPPAATDGRAPRQSAVPAAMAPFRLGDFQLTPLAGIGIQARVLGREDYRLDAESALSPTDLALGWGAMALPENYNKLDISQGGRWYHYRWGPEGPPMPVQQIVRSSANMHMIPADPAVASALAKVRPGQDVRLQGWLVEVSRDDGWRWRSSLTREDSGAGACELIYVCALSAN